jgi:response regulator RpfG family c-di-GMP phosphodiesterase
MKVTKSHALFFLLDSNTPKMNGIEFLKVLKADDALKKVPIIAPTICKEQQYIEENFNLGVTGYIVKPLDYRKFVEVIKIVGPYRTLSELLNL